MSDCGCEPIKAVSDAQRRILKIALILNAAMFVAEIAAGIVAHSTGLIADGLDMLADASAYAIALAAIGRSGLFKANAARASGLILLVLGLGVIVEVFRRLSSGMSPHPLWMIGTAVVALAVNATVLRLLNPMREGEVHLRATWIFTRADVVANGAVIVAGLGVMLTGMRQIDLIVGAGIGLYVVNEAIEILRNAREARYD